MNQSSRRLIGLTGEIATGKSTVSNYLAHHYKLPVLDADIYAKKAVANNSNSSILGEIFKRYGKQIKLPDGTLNRQALGEIIFNNKTEKTWLENKIHPFVYQCFVNNLNSVNSPTVVLSIPLLFEAKMTDLVTEIWVVTCSLEKQIQRLKSRNHLSENQAIARINSQLPLKEKIALADVVLNNNKDLKNLFFQVDRAINKY
jgi:dephospho-CoA kinase